jgi:hypothetical protein
MFTPYIKEEHKEALKTYKYYGRDDGLFYVYFMDNFCNTIVKYLPDTLAPNVVNSLKNYSFTYSFLDYFSGILFEYFTIYYNFLLQRIQWG